MAYSFFYISTALIIILFIICIFLKLPSLAIIIIGITSVAYGMIYEIVLSDRFKLYHYISPAVSTLYIVLSALFLYPLLNMIYTLFLPDKMLKKLLYTSVWIVVMLIFEYVSVMTKTIVFTGWKPIPWSLVTYIFTYLWINMFYGYLHDKCFENKAAYN